MKNILFILLLLPFTNKAQLSSEQQAKVDSLKLVVETAAHDSIIIKSWKAWDNITHQQNPQFSITLNLKIDSLCNINIDKKSEEHARYFFLSEKASSFNNIGLIYRLQGNYTKAYDYFTKSLKIREEMRDKKDIAASLNNIGIIHDEQGNYNEAIDCYIKSLKIKEKIDDKEGIAASFNNIGILYDRQGDYPKAIDYYIKSLRIKEKIGDEQGMARSLNNIGSIYIKQEDYSKAMNYIYKSLKIWEEIGDKQGISRTLNSIGTIHKEQHDHPKAIEYFSKSLNISEEIGKKEGISSSLNNIANLYIDQGNYSKANHCGLRSLNIAKKVGAAELIRDASNTLWKTNRELGNYKESLIMHELYMTMLDSMDSEKNQKGMMRQEFNYNYEKRAVLDSLQALKEKQIAEIEYTLNINDEKNKKIWIGLISSLLIILIILTSLILLQKSKKEQQKLISQLEGIKKQQQVPLKLKAIEFQLNKEKLETSISRKLNETDWAILKIITDHPGIENVEIAQKIFKSKDGVNSSLRRMYKYFDIPSSRYRKISLALKVSKLSVAQAA